MKFPLLKREFYLILKRIGDIVSSLFLLVSLLPFFVVLATLIRIYLGTPVFFKQERPGRNAKPFILIKFRTMTNECDIQGNLLADHYRTKKIGRYLRRTSLDELPELYNILKGEMSFIGPRPLLVKYLPFYTPVEQERHKVRPGITGLAQVNGRNLLSWDERLKLDVKYAQKVSLRLDIKIAIKTVYSVMKQTGVLEVSSETIPDFDVFRIGQEEGNPNYACENDK